MSSITSEASKQSFCCSTGEREFKLQPPSPPDSAYDSGYTIMPIRAKGKSNDPNQGPSLKDRLAKIEADNKAARAAKEAAITKQPSRQHVTPTNWAVLGVADKPAGPVGLPAELTSTSEAVATSKHAEDQAAVKSREQWLAKQPANYCITVEEIKQIPGYDAGRSKAGIAEAKLKKQQEKAELLKLKETKRYRLMRLVKMGPDVDAKIAAIDAGR